MLQRTIAHARASGLHLPRIVPWYLDGWGSAPNPAGKLTVAFPKPRSWWGGECCRSLGTPPSVVKVVL